MLRRSLHSAGEANGLALAVRVTGKLVRIEMQGDDRVMIAFCSCFARRVKAARGANL